MQVTMIESITQEQRKQMIKQVHYSSAVGEMIGFEQIPKAKGLNLFAEIRQLFGNKVDLQVLLLDATVTGDDNPVWDRSSASAQRHFYHRNMSKNIDDVEFDGFR
jgi:hypothetical protein